MKKHKLSIIVPVFRAEKSIDRLIKSLEEQEFKNYELILVNDISDDEHTKLTTKIIKENEKKYSNIVRIDMPHTKYQGNARNEGLKYATGEYITFADSDDYYSSEYFEKLIPAIEKNKFDILTFNFCAKNNKKTHRIIKEARKEKMYFDKYEGSHLYMKGYLCYAIANACWNKIYKKEFLDNNNFKFIENYKTREDYVFNIICFSKVKEIYNLNEDLYIYVEDDNSDSRKFCSSYVDDLILNYTFLKNVLSDDKDFDRYMGLYYLKTIVSLVSNESINPDYNNGKINIKKYFENENIKKCFLSIKKSDFDYKLWIYYIIYKLHIYNLLYMYNSKNRNI